MRHVTHNSIQLIDEETGEITKTIKLATAKQMAFIRSLEKQAEIPPKKYYNLTIWQASKVIDKLKDKTSQPKMV